MTERLTAEERSAFRKQVHQRQLAVFTPPVSGTDALRILDSLDAAEAEAARLQASLNGRNDLLGVLYKEMELAFEQNNAEDIRLEVFRWLCLLEVLEGRTEPT